MSDVNVPISIQIDLSNLSRLIDDVQSELTAKAQNDKNKCFGYFPSLQNRAGIDCNLPKSRQLALSLPSVEVKNKLLTFNFLRISLIKQTGESPFHLDSDSATALTGDASTAFHKQVWRLLLNLHTVYPRRLCYLKAAPRSLPLSIREGYINCDNKHIRKGMIETLSIAPRNSHMVHGILFCANQVLHTGRDDEHGHFVVSYGCDLPIPVELH